KEMVVVATRGEEPTGGYLVDIVDAEVRGRKLRILVGEHDPQPGVLQIQALTQPYIFIALPAVAARVEFKTVREAGAGGTERNARPGEAGTGAPARKPVRTTPSPLQ